MARTRAQTAAQQGLPSPASKDQRKQPQDIQSRESAPRKRGRLQEPATKRTERNRSRHSTIAQQDQPASENKGRKRKQSVKDALEHNVDSVQKRQRTSDTPPENTFGEPATGAGALRHATDPIAFWANEGYWPEEQYWPEVTSQTDFTMEHLLARKKSSSNISRKRLNSATSATPSDQKPREEKSAPYRDQRYETLLETKGSFMVRSKLDITSESKTVCRNLLEKQQPVPDGSLFRDDIFESTCQKIHNKNEARVIQDITRLIVPSAETLATFGATCLDILTESVNEGWNNSIPFTSTRPQPDYSVGFSREAFTDDQLTKLSPFIGDFIFGDRSFFMATYYMYFPFLTCEVKCGAAALDIADRQNAHSMTLAVRAIVELFRAVKREGEVHRQVLAFSISHDHRSVRIYGHYPVVEGKETKYYRHPIRDFSFTELDGKDKWAAYRFTKNVYDTWMPAHFKNICSAIDQLPSNLDFDVPPLSEVTSLSWNLGKSGPDSPSVPVEQDSQSSNAEQQGATPGTSFAGPGPVKRRKEWLM